MTYTNIELNRKVSIIEIKKFLSVSDWGAKKAKREALEEFKIKRLTICHICVNSGLDGGKCILTNQNCVSKF